MINLIVDGLRSGTTEETAKSHFAILRLFLAIDDQLKHLRCVKVLQSNMLTSLFQFRNSVPKYTYVCLQGLIGIVTTNALFAAPVRIMASATVRA